jgi:hypothetical protein
LYVEGPSMLRHELFEELCALQTTGQLSADEQQQLNEHLVDCESCRAACDEFSVILRELPVDEHHVVDKALLRHVRDGALRERFLDRARVDGRRFSEQAQKGPSKARWKFPRLIPAYQWLAAAVLLAVFVDVAAHLRAMKGKQDARLAGSQHAPAISPGGASASNEFTAKLAELQASYEASGKTTASVRNENAALLVRVEILEHQLAADQAGKQDLERTIAHVGDLNSQLAAEVDENTQLLAQAKAELEKVRSDRTVTEAQVAAERAEVNDLSEQVRLQTASLDHDHDLLAAGRDITDLMGARNLHIIDVHDADGSGNDRKSFGRVFYTEGKSLIFYAFDLDDRKVENAKYTFEAWGERLGQPTPVKSLGVLYMDDKQQQRWFLKVDDPRQLAEIDSVFVTLEPHGGDNEKPRGQRILYAFLGGQANHP